MNSAYIKSGASVYDEVSSALSTCPSDYYFVVSQPGVHSSDFSTRKSAPRLGAKLMGKDKSIHSKMTVNEVAGLVDGKQIKTLLVDQCKAQTTAIDGSSEWPDGPPAPLQHNANQLELTRIVIKQLAPILLRLNLAPGSSTSHSPCSPWARTALISLPIMVGGSSQDDVFESPSNLPIFSDGLLSDIIERLPSDSKYTLLYITSPREFPESDSVVYDSSSEFNQDSSHMELKRDYSARSSYSSAADSADRRRSLFDEYQYFTPGSYPILRFTSHRCVRTNHFPGIFMGLIASFFFFLILYIGISALTSLEVSYAAFEKDTSSTVQKKQQ